MKKSKFIFLGTGGSMGIPVVGCQCAVCTSKDPHNERLRPSVLLKTESKTILIDSSPDFRYQALRANIHDIDSVIFTHAHHDHTAGIDDLRIFTLKSGNKLPCLLSKDTLRDLQRRFYYIFEDVHGKPKVTTNLEITLFPEAEGEVNFEGLRIGSFTYKQSGMLVNGLRLGELAFLTDIKEYDSSIFEFLKGIKILIISALRFTPSHFHLTVDEAVDFALKSGAEKVWLTHIAHELDHEKTNAYLPEHIRLCYDGLEIEFNPECTQKLLLE